MDANANINKELEINSFQTHIRKDKSRIACPKEKSTSEARDFQTCKNTNKPLKVQLHEQSYKLPYHLFQTESCDKFEHFFKI